MSELGDPLVPWSITDLLARVEREWTTRGEIFGLPDRRFFRPDPAVDLAPRVPGRRRATAVGPAAGPHTQLAQNLVLAWLAGSRSFELKTVQVLDDLEIDRPCIDMEHVGYNVEWSQELRLEQSLEEYAKAALMIAVLRRWPPLRAALGEPDDAFFDHVFELSVGYDLAGIRSDKMTAFLQGIRDIGGRIDPLRAGLPPAFAALGDAPVPAALVTMTNLSTFHGCPPDEIEGIVKHLMTAHDLDVTVKLNPTLLGHDTVREILNERLGYDDVQLVPDAFAEDLKFDRALQMIESLRTFAAGRGRRFGIKLTNTLVVENHRGVMPGERMYLSGPPLHVLAVTLLDRLVEALPGVLAVAGTGGDVPVAFSAGIDKDNLADVVALGLEPVTVCSDLLRPGGYGRLGQALRKLTARMKENGLPDLAALERHAAAEARAAGRRDAVQALAARYAEPQARERYGKAAVSRPLRTVDNDLQVFDCVACNNCVSVCPNNAFLALPTGAVPGLAARSQYAVLAELCNDCGNCATFCPERGAPQRIKPRLHLSPEAWTAEQGRGFLLVRGEAGRWIARRGTDEDPAIEGRLNELLATADAVPLAGED